jgi:dolichol-phosphate mannosyltransferase
MAQVHREEMKPLGGNSSSSSSFASLTSLGSSSPCSTPSASEVAVVVFCLGDSENLGNLLPRVAQVSRELGISSRTYVVFEKGAPRRASEAAREFGAEVITQKTPGYGGALRTALEQVRARYVVTLDANLSHHPAIVKYLYEARNEADIIIASRYVEGGFSQVPFLRSLLSRALNRAFHQVLSLPIHDLSSGYRLYHREALAHLKIRHSTFAALPEIVTKAWCAGYQVREIPFHYLAGRHKRGASHLFQFAADYLSVLWEMWKVRNSVASADYDWRAFHSRIPLQRWWQRKRYHIILDYISSRMRVLDVGCGSSQILNGAPQTVGVDVQMGKLRFMRRPGRRLANASIGALPFRDAAFEAVVCSEVIEHVPESDGIFEELLRVLEPGGSLILGTPDYGSWQWPILEKLYGIFQPAGYAEEHITHYTRERLIKRLSSMGLTVEDTKTIWNAEMIIHARKPR